MVNDFKVKCKECGSIFPFKKIIEDFIPEKDFLRAKVGKNNPFIWDHKDEFKALKCPICELFAYDGFEEVGFEEVNKEKQKAPDEKDVLIQQILEYLEYGTKFEPVFEKLKVILSVYKPYIKDFTEYCIDTSVEVRKRLFDGFTAYGFTREESLQLTISSYNEFKNSIKDFSNSMKGVKK